MFQLDDNFLKDLGLDDMPQDQKTAFLQHIYEQLELRVGTRLADGLSDQQLAEFESLIERDTDKVTEWLANNVPDYSQQPDFQKMSATVREKGGSEKDNIDLLAEYAATKWLELNRPDYRDVVAGVLEEIKKEIQANRDSIVG